MVETIYFQSESMKCWNYLKYLPVVLLVGFIIYCFLPTEKPVSKTSTTTLEDRCLLANFEEYLRLSSMLSDKEAQIEMNGGISVDLQISQRRAVENYCRKEAQCELLGSNKNKNPLIFSSSFSSCIKEEELQKYSD